MKIVQIVVGGIIGMAAGGAGGFLIGSQLAARPPAPIAWALPANPALIPVWTAAGQEMIWDARTYPVAVVNLSDVAALKRLNRAWTIPRTAPHRLGVVAVVAPRPIAVTTVARRLRAAHVAMPWGLVIDPPPAYQHPAVQLFLPTTGGNIRHVTGSAVWAAWSQAVRPLPLPPAVTHGKEAPNGHRI